jgi:hypothetical protein
MRAALSSSIALALLACVPHLDDDPSRVAEERVLAVRSEPAEAAPGESVVLTALDADANGAIADAALDWAACLARLPLSEPGPVARACIAGEPDALDMTTHGPTTTITLSNDACRLFGPDPPPATEGQPSGRPVDPDSTGGYVQPVRIALEDGTIALAFVRLHCGVAGATREQAAELRRRYHPNRHPRLETLTIVHEDGSFQDAAPGVALHVTTSEHVTFRASWPACPEEGACEGAEQYARFDRTDGVVLARESLRVSWLGTLGRFREPRTGRTAAELETLTENDWTAPDAPASGTIFVVLRDDREGVSWIVLPVVVD